MTLMIALILLYNFNYGWGWYLFAILIWLLRRVFAGECR